MAKLLTYNGTALTIRYDPRRCIHAAECVKGNRSVFDPDKKPWIDPDAGDAEAVAKIVESCPSGALTFERSDGSGERAAATNTVRVDASGPVYLAGELEIQEVDGSVRHETRAALCRCGKSNNKPFCDNRHTKIGFSDEGNVGDAKTKDAAAGQTRLVIRILADGPVLLDGPYRLHDSAGEVRMETGSGYLCRCGASSDKPFCDGSHKPAGFHDPASDST